MKLKKERPIKITKMSYGFVITDRRLPGLIHFSYETKEKAQKGAEIHYKQFKETWNNLGRKK